MREELDKPSGAIPSYLNRLDMLSAVGRLDAWFETMRQQGGYGGPVVHWWRHSLRYTGPGIDWRYEGILQAHATLYQRTHQSIWRNRIELAVNDVVSRQLPEGSYPASRFEQNPGTLGTPHEAAATIGLLKASPFVSNPSGVVDAAKRNLAVLIDKLWDPVTQGFNDVPGVVGRVPNKLATMAEALMTYMDVTGDSDFEPYVVAALNDIVWWQTSSGAVHQYVDQHGQPDGRFFPYYNARCVGPLVLGGYRFGNTVWIDAAERVVDFLTNSMDEDGSWPQIIYEGGQIASVPRWGAGTADILSAFMAIGRDMPKNAAVRLLSLQMPHGGFPAASGRWPGMRKKGGTSEPWTSQMSIAGWNDKVFKLLAQWVTKDDAVPTVGVAPYEGAADIDGSSGYIYEDGLRVTIGKSGRKPVYEWIKSEPWARIMRL